MSEIKIEPALTAEEWTAKHHWIQCFDSWSEAQSEKTGVGEISAGFDYLTLTGHQHAEIADFSAPTDRHALAALCLYGQPFGFTQDDVDFLEQQRGELMTASYGRGSGSLIERQLASLADRIAALLPPAT